MRFLGRTFSATVASNPSGPSFMSDSTAGMWRRPGSDKLEPVPFMCSFHSHKDPRPGCGACQLEKAERALRPWRYAD